MAIKIVKPALSYSWHTPGRYQGQMCQVAYPQLSGAAEGQEGEAAGLQLSTSPGSFELSKNSVVLLKSPRVTVYYDGAGDPRTRAEQLRVPTVVEAMYLAAEVAKGWDPGVQAVKWPATVLLSDRSSPRHHHHNLGYLNAHH